MNLQDNFQTEIHRLINEIKEEQCNDGTAIMFRKRTGDRCLFDYHVKSSRI